MRLSIPYHPRHSLHTSVWVKLFARNEIAFKSRFYLRNSYIVALILHILQVFQPLLLIFLVSSFSYVILVQEYTK